MLKRSILKRITRLGLAFYSMAWCMSFTVCAGEAPLSDLAIADKVEIVSETDLNEEDSAADEASSEISLEEPDAEEPEEPSAEASEESSDDAENEASAELSDDEQEAVEAADEEISETEEQSADEASLLSSDDFDEESLFGTEEGEEEPEEFTLMILTQDLDTTKAPDGSYYINLEDFSKTNRFSVWIKIGEHNYADGYDLTYFLSAKGSDFAPEDLVQEYKGCTITPTEGRMTLLNASDYSATDNDEFYVVARCKYEEEYYYASMKIRYIPYDRDIYDIGMIHEPDGFSFYEPVNVRYQIAQYRSELTGHHEECSRLDPACIEWGLKEELNSTELFDKLGEVEIRGNGVTADLIMEKATHPCTINICVRYHNEDGSVAERTGRLFLNLPVDQSSLGARIPTDSGKVQLYNSTNIVPITFYHVDKEGEGYLDKDKVVEGNIIEASFTDETLNQLFDVLPATEGKKANTVTNAVNIVTKKAALDPENKTSAELLDSLLRSKGVRTKINIKVSVYSAYNNYEPDADLVTENEITLTFSGTKPVIKNLKASQTLVFNSYKAGSEALGISFTGADIAYFTAENLPEGFLFDRESQTVSTTDRLPSTGKGSFKVRAFLSDRTYNLPTEAGYNVTVNYVIKNNAPTVAVSKTALDLNKYTGDSENIIVSIKNFTEGTTIDKVVLDSKGNVVSAPLPLEVEGEPEEGKESAVVSIKVTDKAQAGQTYKVRLSAKNTVNDRKGAAKDVTVRIVADNKAAVGKLGLTIKAKSGTSIDASLPTKPLTLTVTGKNFNTFGKKPEISVLTGDQVPITGLFDIPDSTDGKTFTISEKYDEDHYFALLNRYAGQKVSINVTYRIDENTIVSGILKTTIKKSTVTPKLKATKVSINPDYDKDGIIVPVTNLPEKIYDYEISLSLGKDKQGNVLKVPFTAEKINLDEYPGQDLIKFTPIPEDMPSALGKTCTVTVLPKKTVSGSSPIALNAKAASLKITILDTGKKKNAPALTGTVKGSIDSLKPGTNVTATIGVKNVYNPDAVLGEITCESIVLGRSTADLKDEFEVTPSGNTLVFKNPYEGNLTAGSYKAKIVAVVTDAKGEESTLTTTLTFKVTRSKTGLKAVTGKGTLYNRDFNNFAKYKFSKKTKNVNAIRKVKTSAAYEGKYDVLVSQETSDSVTIIIGFERKTGYYEKTTDRTGKEAPITKAVTRKIPVEVYYYGSSAPDKVTLTVTVKP